MLLKDITALRGPSGWEDEARNAIRSEAESILAGREGRVYSDTMGNLYAYRKGTDEKKPHVMLAAHMDEVGFVVRFANEQGLLKVYSVGGIDPRCAVSKRVIVGEKAVLGVIGVKAIHLMSEADRKKAPDYEMISIDIGAKDKAEAESLCPPGCYATFESEYVEFGDGFVKAKALDDRAGCMILLDVLKESDYAGDITCVFTVQEEVALRGATVAARKVKPDRAIIIDTTTANDMGMTDSHKQVTVCGEGPALTFMDRRIITDVEVQKEPHMALDGGDDGLDFYRAVSKNFTPALNRGGVLAFEVGLGQFEDVMSIMESVGYTAVQFRCDLAGIERVVWGTWEPKE